METQSLDVAAPRPRDPDVDALRYRLLGRLAGGMRHALAGELQGLQFAVELALRSAQRDPGDRRVLDMLAQLKRQAQTLSTTSRGIVEWLRPDNSVHMRVDEAVAQCLKVAGDDWALRSIEASRSVETVEGEVHGAAFCELVVAALYAVTDAIAGPSNVNLAARGDGAAVAVDIAAAPADREPAIEGVVAHPAIGHRDVAALARARDVECTIDGAGVRLRFAKL